MKSAPFLVLLVFLLAGCAEGGKPGNDPPVDDGTPTVAPITTGGGAELRVGNAWQYLDGAGEKQTIVIVDFGKDSFRTGAATDNEAFWEARYDSPFIGNLTSKLIGEYRGKPVQLLPSGPMDWTVDWAGQQRTHKATVRGNLTDVAVSNEAGLVLSYTYDKELGWFSSIADYGPGGQVLHSLQFSKAGNETAEVRYHLEPVINYHKSGFNPGDVILFRIPDGATDFWIDASLRCDQSGLYSITLQSRDTPSAPKVNEAGPCMPEPVGLENQTFTDLAAGQWVLELLATSVAGFVDADGFIRTRESLTLV